MFRLRSGRQLIGLVLGAALASGASTPARAADADQSAADTPEADVGEACLSAFEAQGQERAAALRASDDRRKAALPQHPGWTDCRKAAADVCAMAARHEIPGADRVLSHRRTCLRLNANLTSAPAVGAEIARSIAQVVVTKAQAAGWEILLEHIQKAAHCGDPRSKFPRACQVLGSLSIKDLVAAPAVLLDAVAGDVLAEVDQMNPAVKTAAFGGSAVLGVVLLEATARWSQAGAPGIVAATRKAIVDQILQQSSATCDQLTTSVERYGYVFGMCLIQGPWSQLDKCDAGDLIDQCGGTPDDQALEHRLWDLTTTAFATTSPKPIDILNLGFAIAQAQLDQSAAGKASPSVPQQYLSGTKDLLEGLVDNDWVQATSGAVRVVELLEGDPQVSPKEQALLKDGADVLRIMAAVGNYALTFDAESNKDPAQAAAAREKIITELVDRMVNRTDRKSGAVVSLGGALGLLGGSRFDKTARQWAFPVQLTLGVGLQTYGTGKSGYHVMFSVVDLGQYVSLNDSGSLQVESPDLKAAIALGLTVGGWLALRETPLYLGAFGSIAPFNQAAGTQTYEVGLVTGIYVPLLDFN